MTLNGFRLKETKARYDSEEKAELDAKVAPLIAEQSRMLKELRKTSDVLVKRFWSQEMTTDVILAAKADPDQSIDPVLDVPEGKVDSDICQEALLTFIESLPKTDGVTLSLAGLRRLTAYGTIQYILAGKDMSTVDSWRRAYQRLVETGAMSDDEQSYNEADKVYVAPVEPVKQTLDEIRRPRVLNRGLGPRKSGRPRPTVYCRGPGHVVRLGR